MEYPKLSREIYIFNDGENGIHFGSIHLFPGEGQGITKEYWKQLNEKYPQLKEWKECGKITVMDAAKDQAAICKRYSDFIKIGNEAPGSRHNDRKAWYARSRKIFNELGSIDHGAIEDTFFD